MAKRKSRKSRRRKKNILPKIVATLTVFLGVLILLGYLLEIGFSNKSFGRRNTDSASSILREIQGTLNKNGVAPAWIKENNGSLRVRLPADLHPLLIYQKLSERISRNGGKIAKGKVERNGRMSLAYSVKTEAVKTIWLIPDTTLQRSNAKIEIIIDDFGYHHNEIVKDFIDVSFPVTYAIIPGLAHSDKIARELGRKNKAVMIHMPMEPQQGPVESGAFTLLTTLSAEEIRSRMRKAIETIPFAAGVNNHMGSKATTDSLLLSAAFTELQKSNYYFVDSRTSSESIAYEMAHELGIPARRNDIFLDPVDNQETIAQKIYALAETAKRNGSAIGIGHPRPNTLAALREVVPELQALGYRFVAVAFFFKAVLTMKNEAF